MSFLKLHSMCQKKKIKNSVNFSFPKTVKSCENTTVNTTVNTDALAYSTQYYNIHHLLTNRLIWVFPLTCSLLTDLLFHVEHPVEHVQLCCSSLKPWRHCKWGISFPQCVSLGINKELDWLTYYRLRTPSLKWTHGQPACMSGVHAPP